MHQHRRVSQLADRKGREPCLAAELEEGEVELDIEAAAGRQDRRAAERGHWIPDCGARICVLHQLVVQHLKHTTTTSVITFKEIERCRLSSVSCALKGAPRTAFISPYVVQDAGTKQCKSLQMS